MIGTEIHQPIFPIKQPEDILRLLQQLVTSSPVQHRLPPGAAQVLILDYRGDKAQYVAQFLLARGYTAKIATSGMEAFTLFLQERLAPLIMLSTQEVLPDRFFLQRLVQQMRQKYGWEPMLVHLPTALIDLYILQTTEPPAPITRTSSQTTTPLSHRSEAEKAKERGKKISLEGHNLGRYQIHSLLGEGPRGAVYTAYDRLREQNIALKAVQTDASSYFSREESLFQQEEQVLDGLKHPHILPLLTTGKSYVSGSPFLYKTMPLCAGGSLAGWLASHVHLRGYHPRVVLAATLPLAGALHVLHERQVTHNNFKLTNLLISGTPDRLEGLQLMLADFLPHQDNQLVARTPENFPFLAPEQWQGRSLPASDQYALAVLIYRLLTGRFPFLGETEPLLRQMHLTAQLQSPNRFNRDVSPALNAVILTALAKNPHERFPSLAEFARALEYSRE